MLLTAAFAVPYLGISALVEVPALFALALKGDAGAVSSKIKLAHEAEKVRNTSKAYTRLYFLFIAQLFTARVFLLASELQYLPSTIGDWGRTSPPTSSVKLLPLWGLVCLLHCLEAIFFVQEVRAGANWRLGNLAAVLRWDPVLSVILVQALWYLCYVANLAFYS